MSAELFRARLSRAQVRPNDRTWMPHHEHVFVETPEANLSAGMQYLGGSYTSYTSRG